MRRSYSRIVLVAVVTRLLAAGLQPGGPIAVQELAAAFERAGLTVSWETVDEYADMLVAPSLLARWFATA